jgi:CRISPR type III-B/RAMP module-associated protein Cmr5
MAVTMRSQDLARRAALDIQGDPNDRESHPGLLDKPWRKNYRDLWKKVPYLILTNGLMQTSAFLADKVGTGNDADPAYTALLRHLRAIVPEATGGSLLEAVTGMDRRQYLRATRTILDAAIWYKRFSVALVGDDE